MLPVRVLPVRVRKKLDQRLEKLETNEPVRQGTEEQLQQELARDLSEKEPRRYAQPMGRNILDQRLEKLETIERVRAKLKHVVGEKLTVPGVVVVGAQSSGKSSVLENATGLAFPRGEGTCTRVPATVSVEYVSHPDETGVTCAIDPAYTESRHDLGVHEHDAFASAIRALTNKLASAGEISDSPIYIKLRKLGSGAPFTLTDVPGITFLSKTQTDIEKTTIALTRKLIKGNDETLILVVLPATEDFQNSKALQIAEEEDPQGKRTIGIVTKVDNLPPGSKLLASMAGEDHPLKHGYYAVRNRTQKEIDDGMTIDDLNAAESSLFCSDPILSQIASEQCGIEAVLKKISSEQALAIERCIPKLKRDIYERTMNQKREISKLPKSLLTNEDRVLFLGSRLGKIAILAARCASADTTVLGVQTKTTNLSARVHESLRLAADNSHEKMPDFLSDEHKDELLLASQEALGYDLSNFMQGSVFRDHFKGVVPMLLGEATTALDAVVKSTLVCLTTLVLNVFPEDEVAPQLAAELCDLLDKELAMRHDKAMDVIQAISKAEMATTHTNNHYLAQTIAKFKQTIAENSHNWRKGLASGASTGTADLIPTEFLESTAETFQIESNEAAAVREMQITMHAYSKVVQKRYTDTVSVLIINNIVTELVDDLPALSAAWTPQLVALLVEDQGVARKRKDLTRSIASLEEAAMDLKKL